MLGLQDYERALERAEEEAYKEITCVRNAIERARVYNLDAVIVTEAMWRIKRDNTISIEDAISGILQVKKL